MPHTLSMQHRHGFTLVELSIVLVILGLLVGGVLSGQSLIRAAELRTVTTERDKYFTALNAFRDKYQALPGDMPNAFAFWGAQGAAGCATDTDTIDTGCNGNGNGQIETASTGEVLKLWMHLTFSGLIEGTYSGVQDAGDYWAATNIPKAKFANGAWYLSSGAFDVPSDDGNYLTGGVYLTLANAFQANGLRSLTHAEAWNIDKKADDGRANSGSMRGSDNGDCWDMNTDGNAANGNEDSYGMANGGANAAGDCLLHFIYRK